MKLRKYQVECLKTIEDTFKTRNNQLIQLPTGAGKTVVFLSYAAKNAKRTLVVCPTIDLIEQCREASSYFYHPSEVFAKFKNKRLVDAKLVIMAGASLDSEAFLDFSKKYPFDLLVFDEAHKAHCRTYSRFIGNYQRFFPDVKILGVTATPERSDGKPLLSLFGELSFDRNILDLINDGYLCDISSYRIKTKDKISLHNSTSFEFKVIVYKMLDNESRNRILLETFTKECKTKKTLIFCLSIAHSHKVADSIKALGISAAAIDGTMSFEQRRSLLSRFKTGELQVLTNCQLLTEGFDEPSIEAIIIARPTKSKSLYCQMIGRGVRKHPGKDICYLYELTDNAHKICTFNVAGGGDISDTSDYLPGTKLSEYKKHKEIISLADITIEKEKMDVFENARTYSSFLAEMKATPFQKQLLDTYKITYFEPISFLEAGFLIWLNNLKDSYGFNKTN